MKKAVVTCCSGGRRGGKKKGPGGRALPREREPPERAWERESFSIRNNLQNGVVVVYIKQRNTHGPFRLDRNASANIHVGSNQT